MSWWQVRAIKEEIETTNVDIESAEQLYELNRAAELKYSTRPALQQRLAEAEEARRTAEREAEEARVAKELADKERAEHEAAMAAEAAGLGGGGGANKDDIDRIDRTMERLAVAAASTNADAPASSMLFWFTSSRVKATFGTGGLRERLAASADAARLVR